MRLTGSFVTQRYTFPGVLWYFGLKVVSARLLNVLSFYRCREIRASDWLDWQEAKPIREPQAMWWSLSSVSPLNTLSQIYGFSTCAERQRDCEPVCRPTVQHLRKYYFIWAPRRFGPRSKYSRLNYYLILSEVLFWEMTTSFNLPSSSLIKLTDPKAQTSPGWISFPFSAANLNLSSFVALSNPR